MTNPKTRQQLKDYCLRKLGHPVIQINVSDEQVDDRIDDALQYFQDYHFDGTEKIFMKHQITQEDIDRRWIHCPDAVNFVVSVLPWDDSNSSVNMFDLRYQLRLHDLYDFTSVSYVSYDITMKHIRNLNLLFSGTPQFRFTRHTNKIYLDIDWERDVEVGTYCIIECYRVLNPTNIQLTGTLHANTSSNTVIGNDTIFDQELLEDDIIKLSDGREIQIEKIISPTEMTLTKIPEESIDNLSFIKEGLSDIWGDRFFKRYATAKIKYQWGSNLSKYAQIPLPGGVLLDGVAIKDEAQLELDKLEEDMQIYNVIPPDFFIG